jgi:hypothetical protein
MVVLRANLRYKLFIKDVRNSALLARAGTEIGKFAGGDRNCRRADMRMRKLVVKMRADIELSKFAGCYKNCLL